MEYSLAYMQNKLAETVSPAFLNECMSQHLIMNHLRQGQHSYEFQPIDNQGRWLDPTDIGYVRGEGRGEGDERRGYFELVFLANKYVDDVHVGTLYQRSL